MATPVTEPSFGKSVGITGSSSAPLPRTITASFHPAALGRRSRPQSPPGWIPVPCHLGRELHIQGLWSLAQRAGWGILRPVLPPRPPTSPDLLSTPTVTQSFQLLASLGSGPRTSKHGIGPSSWDLAADPDHLAIFLVEATGRLADDSAMKLLKLIVQEDSPNGPYIIHHYCTQIGGAIACYNAMAAHAWVQYSYLRS
jgi:hypothetical protein